MRAGSQSSPYVFHLLTVGLLSVLIIDKLARGHRWSRNLDPNSCPGPGIEPRNSRLGIQHANHWITAHFTPFLVQLRFLSCVQNITRCYHLANSTQTLRSLPPTVQQPYNLCPSPPNYILPSKVDKNFVPSYLYNLTSKPRIRRCFRHH